MVVRLCSSMNSRNFLSLQDFFGMSLEMQSPGILISTKNVIQECFSLYFNSIIVLHRSGFKKHAWFPSFMNFVVYSHSSALVFTKVSLFLDYVALL